MFTFECSNAGKAPQVLTVEMKWGVHKSVQAPYGAREMAFTNTDSVPHRYTDAARLGFTRKRRARKI